MATIGNLFVDAGSDYSDVITVMSVGGAPLDLTGHTVKSQMRKSYNSSQAFDFTANIITPQQGRITLSLTAAQSELIPAGRWLYDVEITNTSTLARKRVVEGIVTVTPQITQS